MLRCPETTPSTVRMFASDITERIVLPEISSLFIGVALDGETSVRENKQQNRRFWKLFSQKC